MWTCMKKLLLLYEIISNNMKQNETKTGGMFEMNLGELEKTKFSNIWQIILTGEKKGTYFSP